MLSKKLRNDKGGRKEYIQESDSDIIQNDRSDHYLWKQNNIEQQLGTYVHSAVPLSLSHTAVQTEEDRKQNRARVSECKETGNKFKGQKRKDWKCIL